MEREFEDLYRAIVDHTVVDRDRCLMLFRPSRHAATLAGDMAEVGVFNGGTSLLLAGANRHKRLHAFDTFAGLPATDPALDGYGPGDFAARAE